MALFTPEELEELRHADAELDRTFRMTQAEVRASNRRDREVIRSRRTDAERRRAATKRAWDNAHSKERSARTAAQRAADPEKYKRYLEQQREYHRTIKMACQE